MKEELRTRLDMSTAYHPQTDGQSECTIETLEDMLRLCVLDIRGSWDVHLPLVKFSYNNSYHSSERCVPFEALYGKKCRSPIMWAEVGEGHLIGPDALNSKLLSINSQHLDNEKQEVKNVVEQPAKCGNRNIQSLQNFRVVHKGYISFKNTSQISLIHAVAPILSTKEPEYSSSMGYEHSNTTPKTKLDEIIKSGVEELLPILSENEITLEDKRECDLLVCEDSSVFDVCDNHSDIFSDSKDDDDISSDDDDFKDIEYVEASFFDPKIVIVEEENVVQQQEEESDNSLSDNFSPEFKTFCDYTEETRSGNTTHADNSLPEYDSFCFEIEPDQERLINLVKNDISDDSNDPLLEEADLFLASDNSIPSGIENVADDSEGDICFLEELLIDDSILSHESSDSYFENNPSIPRPPPEQPDAETDAGEEILVVMNDKDKFDEDYYFFIFDKVFSFLSAESEDTIFDPGFTLSVEVFLCWIFVPVSKIFTSFDLILVWGSPYPLIYIA
nr:putative reverse transcriptase domain-containing protein [Tanacetum cinerariifolium]